MVHLPELINDLGLILISAALVTLLCRKLKQPVVLGYLIAGFIVGPNFGAFPTVKDTKNIAVWAEIGVIFMLFSLGLEFSFKKLARVGKSASITATFEILSMLGLGYLAGRYLGWSQMDSLFLGGILSISSTTIIVRAFEELGMKGKGFVSLVFGVLIVEDLIAILLLVLLSSVAVTQSLSGSELAFSSLRLVFFLVLWFLLGIYLLPIFLRRYRDLFSDETMLIVSIGLCLMMVIVASHVGFSPALGAFVMGSILAETPKGHRIEHLILPVKDLFSAIFFVSVGMLIDPKVLNEYFGVILIVTLLTIFGKFLSSSLGALVSGVSVRSSVQAGLSLAQIGEFSFIIATLGKTLQVTSDFLYPIAVAVSAVTTFTTPYQIKYSDRIYQWLEKRIPALIKESLKRYETALNTPSSENIFSFLWKEYGIKTVLNSVLVIAITLGISRFALPHLEGVFSGFGYEESIACVVTLLISAPFLWAVFLGRPPEIQGYPVETVVLLGRLQIVISALRFLIGSILVGFVVSQFTTIWAFSGVLIISIASLSAFFFSRFSRPIYQKIEDRFVENLTENERAQVEAKAKRPLLAPWDANLAEFVVSSSSPLILKTLLDAGIKERFGVTIAMIERGSDRILAPKRDDILLPGDKLYLIGTDEQLVSIRELIERKPSSEVQSLSTEFGLISFVLLATDPFVNKSIRECGLRESVNGLIVGLERDGVRHLSPDSSMKLIAGDLIWIVGDRERVKALRA